MNRNQFSGTFSPDQDIVGTISVLLDFSLVFAVSEVQLNAFYLSESGTSEPQPYHQGTAMIIKFLLSGKAVMAEV